VSVAGARQLKLVVTDAGDDQDSDHGDWAAARLLPLDEFAPPVLVSNTGLLVHEGGRAALTSAELRYDDNVQPAANVHYQLRQPPQGGQLEHRTAPGAAITSFTQADINNGEVVYVHSADAAVSDRFEFEVSDGQGNVLFDQEFMIEVVRVTFLSDLPYAGPPTNGWGPVERDLSNGEFGAGDGRPLMLDGITYAKGLGVHANSQIAFHLNENYARFQAEVGIDDEVGPNGTVVFQVRGDGQLLFESEVLTGNDPPRRLDVPVTGVTLLELRVTDGGDGPGFDHADWSDARLIPVPDTEPPAVTNNRGTSVAADDRVLIVRDELLFEDAAQPPREVVYVLTAPPLHGHLELVGAEGAAIDQFTQQQIDDGRLLYVHDGFGASNGTPAIETLAFEVRDSQGNGVRDQFFEIRIEAVSWLSDLPLSEPATNGWGPLERDLSNGEQALGDGRPITLNGLEYAKGLGVHAGSSIILDLAGGYRRFLADVGADDEVSNGASVVFQVWLDGELRFDSGTLTPDSVTRRVDLDVSDVATLRLEVTDAGDGPGWDHADWAAARLLPLEEPTSTGGPGSS
jgi:hypothetical protein